MKTGQLKLKFPGNIGRKEGLKISNSQNILKKAREKLNRLPNDFMTDAGTGKYIKRPNVAWN